MMKENWAIWAGLAIMSSWIVTFFIIFSETETVHWHVSCPDGTEVDARTLRRALSGHYDIQDSEGNRRILPSTCTVTEIAR